MRQLFASNSSVRPKVHQGQAAVVNINDKLYYMCEGTRPHLFIQSKNIQWSRVDYQAPCLASDINIIAHEQDNNIDITIKGVDYRSMIQNIATTNEIQEYFESL